MFFVVIGYMYSLKYIFYSAAQAVCYLVSTLLSPPYWNIWIFFNSFRIYVSVWMYFYKVYYRRNSRHLMNGQIVFDNFKNVSGSYLSVIYVYDSFSVFLGCYWPLWTFWVCWYYDISTSSFNNCIIFHVLIWLLHSLIVVTTNTIVYNATVLTWHKNNGKWLG